MVSASTLIAVLSASTSVAALAPALPPGAAAASALVAQAAESGQATPSARDVLRQGIDQYRWGHYDQASRLFDQAANLGGLSDKDRQILKRYQLLMARIKEGQAQAADSLNKARLAKQQGDQTKAAALAKEAADSPYATDQIRQEAKALLGELQAATAQNGKLASAYKRRLQAQRLLAQARQQLRSGQLDQAEEYVRQAEALKAPYWLFDDTPAKVRADLAAARKQASGQTGQKIVGDRKQKAKSLVAQAQWHLRQHQLDRAEELAKQAKALKARFWFFETSPDDVLARIQRARQQQLASAAQPEDKPQAGQTGAVTTTTTPAEGTPTEADTEIKQAATERQPSGPAEMEPIDTEPRQPVAVPPPPDVFAQQAEGQSDRQPAAAAVDHKPAPVRYADRKKYAKQLLSQAKAALQKGQVDQAEQLARQAKALKARFWFFETSPDDVLADVFKARQRRTAIARRKSSRPGAAATGAADRPAGEPAATAAAPQTTVAAAPEPPPLAPSPPASQQTTPASEGQLVQVPHTQPPAAEAGPQPSATTSKPLTQLSPDQKKAEYRKRIAQARKLIDTGHLDEAQRVIEEAESLGVTTRWFQGLFADTPERLRRDLARARIAAARRAAGSGTPVAGPPGGKPHPVDARQQALALLRQGRAHLQAGRLDEAERYAMLARQQGASYRLFDDTPNRLIADIARARTARQREAAARDKAVALNLLAEARQDLQHGRLDEAEAKARQALQLHVHYGWFDDRPDKVLASVAKARHAARQAAPARIQPQPAKMAQAAEPTQPIAPTQPSEGPPTPAQQAPVTAAAEPPAKTAPPPAETAGRVAATPAGAPATPAAARQTAPPTETSTATSTATVEQRRPSVAAASQRPEPVAAEPQPSTPAGPRGAAAEGPKVAATAPAPARSDETALVPIGQPGREPAEPVRQASAVATSPAGAPATSMSTPKQIGRQQPPRPEQLAGQPSRSGQAAGSQRRAPAASTTAPSGLQAPPKQVVRLLGGVGSRPLPPAPQPRQPAAEPTVPQAQAASPAPALQQPVLAQPGQQQQAVQQAALQLFQAGQAAVAKGEYAHALALFRQISDNHMPLDPNRQQQLQNYLRDLPVRLAQAQAAATPDNARQPGQPAQGARSFEQLGRREQIELQRLVTESDRSLQKARRLVDSDPAKALEELRRARQRVQASKLSEDLTTPLLGRIDAAIRYANQQKQRADIESLQQQRQIALKEQRKRQSAVESQKQQEVAHLVEQAQALMDEGKFEEAQVLAAQATEIDPENLAAIGLAYQARTQARLARARDIYDRKEEAFVAAMESVDESAIPFDDRRPIRFPDPKKWETLTLSRRELIKRQQEQQRSPQELEIERELEKPVNLNFMETPLSEVIDFLRDYTGVNIVVDEQALEADGITSNTPVTMKLERIPLKSALRHMLGQLNLTHVIQNDALVITTPVKKKGELITKTYPVHDLVIRPPRVSVRPGANFGSGNVPGIMSGGALGLNSAMSFSPLGTPLPSVGLGQVASATTGPQNTFGGLLPTGGLGAQPSGEGQGAGVDFQSLIDLIQNTIEPDSWSTVGGPGTIEEFQPNLSLVISQTQDVHEQIRDLLDQLRRLVDLQVTVEVRFITLSEDFFERIGIDFDMNIQSNGQKPLRSFGRVLDPGDPTAVPPDPPILDLNYKDHDDDLAVGLNGPFEGGVGNNAPFNVGFGQLLKIPFRTNGFARGRPANYVAGEGLNFGVAFLSDIEVYLFLEAAQQDNRSNVLTAPKVTLFNGATAFVFSGSAVPAVIGMVPVVQAGAVAFNPILTYFPNGTFLSVTAVISADRRYVRLFLFPFFSNIRPGPTVRVVGGAGGGGGFGLGGGGAAGGGVGVETTFNPPIIEFDTVITTVSVPDGGTILMGGLKTKTEARNEFGIPILNKLPYVNRLFMNTGIQSTSQSLMLMVTPRIIIQEEEEAMLGKTLAY